VRGFTRGVIAAVLSMGAITGCDDLSPAAAPRKEHKAVRFRSEPIQPLLPARNLPPKVVALGERLFHDKRLSGDGTVACATCHVVAQGGDDGKRVSTGIHEQEGDINALSVLNCGFNVAQFWDGRAATLEEQMGGPLENPKEMGGNWPAALAALSREPSYRAEFEQAFGSGITEANVRSAIAHYERSLVTPNSSFDRWLRGDKNALSTDALAGYELFKAVGCVACHQGQNVGGNMFQRFGVIGDYFADRGNVRTEDYGRYNVTKSEADRFVFRVPSLRNVELTAPYFHDGSAATLEAAVRVMAKYQLGRALPDADVTRISAFLRSLTGELPKPAADRVARTP
jgi:cytochrome c peroxidase